MSDDTPVLSPLDESGIAAAVDAALVAVESASTLDELKSARLAHTGERSPLALANRGIGALAPADKGTAGKLLGAARGRVQQALAARQVVLEAERDARVLVEETLDVTL
ncbi:phenylalanine--tRNA ligase subunit alpha, partial [Cellulomonas rhizosphaerae]